MERMEGIEMKVIDLALILLVVIGVFMLFGGKKTQETTQKDTVTIFGEEYKIVQPKRIPGKQTLVISDRLTEVHNCNYVGKLNSGFYSDYIECDVVGTGEIGDWLNE